MSRLSATSTVIGTSSTTISTITAITGTIIIGSSSSGTNSNNMMVMVLIIAFATATVIAMISAILTTILTTIDFTAALRDVRVQIPHAVRRGEKAILKCLYDLEGDSLYSVKWYKGRREFYSFTPKESPAMKVFQFAGVGVKVDRSQSNESQLALETVNAGTTGKYSCEVSADAPSFHTLIGAGEMEVVVPGKDPIISGIRSRYKVGDIVRGNCTSGHSRPAANITWNVNGYETNPVHIKHYKAVKDSREMETVTSGIHFVVTPQHFIYGKLKIRCTAHIHDVYWKSTEKSVEENRYSRQGANVNVVQTFSEDYFDMEDDNVVDRSDTYRGHIKGDVSSLNASGGSSTLHGCLACFWPRLTTLSLLLYYGVQQMLQLFFGQKTINEKISNCLAFNEKITPTSNENGNSNDNDGQQQQQRNETMQRQRERERERQRPGKGHQQNNQQQHIQQQPKEEYVQPELQQQQQRPALSGTISSEVATICYKEQTNKTELLREKYLQIKLINNKKEQLQQRQQHPLQVEQYLEQQRRQPHQQQHLHYEQQYQQQHQVTCDKTLHEYYNLTMTTQVASNFMVATATTTTAKAMATSTLSVNTVCNRIAAVVPVISAAVHICHKQYVAANHNLFVQQQQQQSCCHPTNTNPTSTSTRSFCKSKDFFAHILSMVAATMPTTFEAATSVCAVTKAAAATT